MFGKTWKTSERKYEVIVERHVSIPMSDGIIIDANMFRPDSPGKFPALLGVHPYDNDLQSAPLRPAGMCVQTGGLEAGDYNFYVRRGYAQVMANQRGTGRSGDVFTMFSPRAVQDVCEMIEWIAGQPWCDGNVGIFGASWLAMLGQMVAHLRPPHLKAIFSPFAASDQYRDALYHGGILAHGFHEAWAAILSNPRFPKAPAFKQIFGEEKFKEAVARASKDPELTAVPFIEQVLKTGMGPIDTFLMPLDCDFYRVQATNYDKTEIPAYLGACWGIYGLHLPGAFRSWENWKGPKKMTIGPPLYLDRPIYQYAYESLRWFDYWLKGIENGIMEGDPIKLFVVGTGEWKTAREWPLPETRWTPFYLHGDGLLSEHEFWPNEGASTFEDSPYNRGSLTFLSPPLVEKTEVVGPMVLNLYASTTDTEVLWFISFLDIDPSGKEKLLTRGWLRGSQRRIDLQRSKPWLPHHVHTQREPLTPDVIYEFNIEIRPYGILFEPGHRIGIRIKCVDDEEPISSLEGHSVGHLWRHNVARITVHHNSQYPSHLLLPVTKGNVLETYMSGGNLPKEHFPYRRR